MPKYANPLVSDILSRIACPVQASHCLNDMYGVRSAERNVDRYGRPFVSYEQVAKQMAVPDTVDYVRFPIPDASIPAPVLMNTILNHIDQTLAVGRPIYVHCWGGVGRTGTVVGCELLRHKLATPANVVQTIASICVQDVQRGHRTSPETAEQRRFVVEWKES